MELLEASNGALESADVVKRSSYKALFIVCLLGSGFRCPCRPPRFLGCLFISISKRSKNIEYINIYIYIYIYIYI